MSISEAEPESTETESQNNLIWIDQSNDIPSVCTKDGSVKSDARTSLEDIDDVRKRLEKRKRRNPSKSLLPEDVSGTKRVRNTLAARRYRQRRQKEVEILDEKLQELQRELSSAKLETKWWQMEAQRWKELAEKKG